MDENFLFTSASIAYVHLQWNVVLQSGPKYGAVQQLPGAPAYKERQDVTGIIGKMVLVNSCPPTNEIFSWKIIRHLVTPPHKFRLHCPAPEKFQEYLLKGSQIVNVLGSPTCLVPALRGALKLRRIYGGKTVFFYF
jgi:hypothetical protein